MNVKKGGEWQFALVLLSTMAHTNAENSTISYGAAISACEMRG